MQFLNVQFGDNSKKLLVSVFYNPTGSADLDLLFSDLQSRLIDFDLCIVCGEFNVNLLANDVKNNNLCDLISSNGLNIVNNALPTRFSNNASPSLLDLFLISF